MHWGLFSVPAYHNEWYEKYMYSAAPSAGVDHSFAGWHAQNFGPPDKFGYKDFIPALHRQGLQRRRRRRAG